MTMWTTTKVTTTVNVIRETVNDMKNPHESTTVTFYAPEIGSGWIKVDQIKSIKGYLHGRYNVTEAGPNQRRWFISRVGPDAIMIATKHENRWYEYTQHAPTGYVTQVKPEMAGMGNTNDVTRMDRAVQLLQWFAPFVRKIDDVLDSMGVTDQTLKDFQIDGFFEGETG